MSAPLSGPGVGLQLPQNLYPTALQSAPYDLGSNRQCLAPGQQLPVPAGTWYVGLGMYLVLQFQDPITGLWVTSSGGGWNRGLTYVKSDGFTCRIANLTGCIVGAVVTSQGTAAYVQSSTTISVTGSTATFVPIIGGQCTVSGTFSLAVPTVGGGYGVAPLVFIPPPPPAANNSNGVGGIPATGYVTIASGTISAFSLTNPGAGYPTAPVPVVLPNPTDPNLATGITQASVAVSLTSSGKLTGALCTNNGAPLTNGSLASVTLTVSGAGATATVSPIVMQTIVSASVTGGGTGYGTTSSKLTTVGGVPAAGTITNPDLLFLAWEPRPADIKLAVTGTGTIATQNATVYDGGLFLGTPDPVIIPGMQAGAAGSVAGPTISLVMGGVPDIAIFQPAP